MEKQTPTFISNFTRISGVLSNKHPALFALNLESLMKLLVFVLSLRKLNFEFIHPFYIQIPVYSECLHLLNIRFTLLLKSIQSHFHQTLYTKLFQMSKQRLLLQVLLFQRHYKRNCAFYNPSNVPTKGCLVWEFARLSFSCLVSLTIWSNLHKLSVSISNLLTKTEIFLCFPWNFLVMCSHHTRNFRAS